MIQAAKVKTLQGIGAFSVDSYANKNRYPPPQTRVAVFGQPDDDSGVEDNMEDKAQLAVKHFQRLRKKLYRWRKYFRANKYDGKTNLDTGLPPNEANVETADPDAYFWCYSHYGDLSPDKLNGEYPDFEECLHVLGGAKWGPREGGDEALAYGYHPSLPPLSRTLMAVQRALSSPFPQQSCCCS